MQARYFSLNLILISSALLLLCTLVGCATGVVLPATEASSEGVIVLKGGVHGGNQPVSSSHIYLYAASTAGYGTAATSLLCGATTTVTCASPSASVLTDANNNGYVVTDSNGGFNVTGDYTCPASGQVYMIAVGGNPGLAGTVNNTDLVMMSALGPCSLLMNNPDTYIQINEVTTVASAYALAPFMTSATSVGTSSTNTVGLANAFATFYNMVNLSAGSTPGIGQPQASGPPAGLPANLTVPSSEINTLANILAYCVNTDPTSSANCSTLFSDLAVGSSKPADTAQAAMFMAQNPGTFNTTTLAGLASSQAAFLPNLSSLPADLTLAITYTGASGTPVNNNNGYSIAVDANGNVYGVNNAAAYLTKITSTGVTSAIGNGIASPAIALSGSYGVAVDLNGNLWVTNTSSGKEALTKLDANGNLLAQATPTSAGGTSNGGMQLNSTPAFIAIDGSDNVWFTNFSSSVQGCLSEFNNSATSISGTAGYFAGLTNKSDKPLGIAIDPSGNAWTVPQKGTHVNEIFGYSGVNGAALPGTPYFTTNTPLLNVYNLAFDSSSNLWIQSRNSYTIVGVQTSGANAGKLLTNEPTAGYAGGGQGIPGAEGATNSLAVDGLSNVWVANDIFNNVSELVTTGANAGTFASPGGTSTSAPGGFQFGVDTGARGVAIDGSGNVWVNGNSKVLEIVGAAAPVVTPLAAAVKANILGQRP